MIVEYHLNQGLDSLGLLEEFTRDFFLLLPRNATAHLNEEGLPVIGSEVYPGMLLIGKSGATKEYRRENLPNDLEQWSEEEDVLISRYSDMFYDGSFYVPEGIYGKVTEAYFEPHDQFKRAVVRIEMITNRQTMTG